MKVIFQPKLEQYQSNWFPGNLSTPPRIGEWVSVSEGYRVTCKSKGIPDILQVTNVIWTSDGVICELWYRDIDRLYYAPV
jgi:hypothetical protein